MIVQKLLPGFLPFQFSLAHDSPVDYSVEIILLQIFFPFVLDGQLKHALHSVLRWWCILVAWVLDLRSYLLGDVPFQPGVRIHVVFRHSLSQSPMHASCSEDHSVK
ncbi:unnamed protein product [Dibothriocephalus latus]|uniref:RING-type E3 ubiquitin transferase n=1 Tax=Dibothriocephalus latus TaxID=60516 RepID=A0A3P7M7K1_DIBLA|nr:unnamed protein product [Dibothriocephalus latus]